MKKETVIVLGNGFDLALGLKTSYSDFYESKFWERDSNIQNNLKDTGHIFLRFITKEYNNNENWFDLENVIKRFAFGTRTGLKPDTVRWKFELLKNKLTAYLSNEVVNLQKDIQILSPDSLVYEFLGLISKAAVLENTIIYTFNYTNLAELESYKEVANKMYHVHGSLVNKDIKIGFSSRRNEKVNSAVNFLNKFIQPNSPGDICSDLESAQDVIIFGHSLNEIDLPYFERMFKKHINNTTAQRVIIITYDNDSEMAIKSNLDNYELRAEDLFSSSTIQFLHTKDYEQKDNEKRMFETLKNRILSRNVLNVDKKE